MQVAEQKKEIRALLPKKKSDKLKYEEGVALQRTSRGRRLSLDRGRAVAFPLAEVGTHDWFKAARAQKASRLGRCCSWPR